MGLVTNGGGSQTQCPIGANGTTACVRGPNVGRAEPNGTTQTAWTNADERGSDHIRYRGPEGQQVRTVRTSSPPMRYGHSPSLYGKGAEKYADHNWRRGYDWSLSFAALQRHAWQFWAGEDNDAETGLPHMASVAFHALALIEFAQTHPEFDNRSTA